MGHDWGVRIDREGYTMGSTWRTLFETLLMDRGSEIELQTKTPLGLIVVPETLFYLKIRTN